MRFAPLALVASVALCGCQRDEDTAGTTLPAAATTAAAGGASAPQTAPSAASAPATDPAPPPTAAAPTTRAAAPVTTEAAPPTTTAAPDPAQLLATALDQLAPGYHFVTTASVGGQVAVSAEGDHVGGEAGGATRMTLTSSGTATDYLIVGQSAWAYADDAWQELDPADSPSEPLAALREPLDVTLVAGDADAATVRATYPAAALGLVGDDHRTVEFQLADGAITALSYVAEPAEVAAAITPLDPAVEITVPSD